MGAVTESVIARGDLAHLALFLWGSGTSALLLLVLREQLATTRRFETFVREFLRELARFTDRLEGPDR